MSDRIRRVESAVVPVSPTGNECLPCEESNEDASQRRDGTDVTSSEFEETQQLLQHRAKTTNSSSEDNNTNDFYRSSDKGPQKTNDFYANSDEQPQTSNQFVTTDSNDSFDSQENKPKYSHTYEHRPTVIPHYPDAIAYPLDALESETRFVQELIRNNEHVEEEEEADFSREPLQFCMVGATIPLSVKDTLGEIVPVSDALVHVVSRVLIILSHFCVVVKQAHDIEVIKTEHVHCVMKHVAHKFFRVSGQSKLGWWF